MNRKIKILFVSFLMLFSVSCSDLTFGDFTKSIIGEKLTNFTEDELKEKKLQQYQLEATFKTNKGDIKVYLYPEAAPINVAHFVYLVKNNFYDNMKFHRVVPSVLIQTGDKSGDGTGTSGVFNNDEIVSWLDFKTPGMLAMANIPNQKNTNSSQIFFTLTQVPQFNNNYTIIGEVANKEGIGVARLIRENDYIISVSLNGNNIDTFLDNFKDEVNLWKEMVK